MDGKVVFGPGRYNSDNFPNGLADIARDIDVLIDYFEQRYHYWFLQPALKLTENPDNGFIVMSILAPYPDMIAQLKKLPYNTEKKQLKHRYYAGLEDLFPILKLENNLPIKKLIYVNLRSEIAHMSFISGNVIFTDKVHYPFLPTETENGEAAVIINPRYWCFAILVHLANYMMELKNPANEKERAAFKNCLYPVNKD